MTNRAQGHRSRALNAWSTLKSRCDNERHLQYRDYGGAGITYDERWKTYANFLADMGEPKQFAELILIDRSKPYCKDNCRWASRTPADRPGTVSLGPHPVQATTRDGVSITHPSIAEASRLTGVDLEDILVALRLSKEMGQPVFYSGYTWSLVKNSE